MKLPTILYRWVKDGRFEKHGENGGIDWGYYELTGSGRNMTPNEYLSTSMGVGGNITGFFEFEDHMDLRGFPGRKTMAQTQMDFGRDRDVIVIPTPYLKEVGVQFVYTDPDLPDMIVACPGMVKVAKLGTLMVTATHYGQESEWNFITNTPIKIPAYRLKSETPVESIVKFTLERYNEYRKPPYPPIVMQHVAPDACPVGRGGKTKLRKHRRRTTWRPRTLHRHTRRRRTASTF